jgi:membrane protein YqaA with SNARE-associated domain
MDCYGLRESPHRMQNATSAFIRGFVQHRSFSPRLLGWLGHLGGPGLILLGLLDNSVVPVPGSMDVSTVLLSAKARDWWPYYAAMATIGSLIGGYLTYRLALKEGAEKIEKRVPPKTWEKVRATFKRWGFGAIAAAAVLPPPTPMKPFLLVAGAAKYSRPKFLGALATGRGIRYFVLAFLGARYGRQIIGVLTKSGLPIVIAVGTCIAVGVAAFFIVRRMRRKSAQHA